MIVINYQNGRVALHFTDIAAIEQRGFSVDLVTYNHCRYYLYQHRNIEAVRQVFDDLVNDIKKAEIHDTINVPHS